MSIKLNPTNNQIQFNGKDVDFSIKLNPTNNQIQLNGKDVDFYSRLENVQEPSENCSNCFVDMYRLSLSDSFDMELSETLSILNNKIKTCTAKLTMVNRLNQKEIVKEYKNEIDISSQYYGSNDIYYYCLDEIIGETNVHKICIDIYKNYLEKNIILRCNAFSNHDYLIDIYLVFDNILYKEIFEKMKLYFEEILKNSNVKLHLVYVILPNTYFDSCNIS
jgi:hypothetical protein